jgi:hypothetical protein
MNTTSGAVRDRSGTTLASSTRTRLQAATAIALLTLGCSSGLATGRSIEGGGPASSGILGFPHAQQGRIYRFSFPLLKNTSKSPLSVTSFGVDSVPAQVKVLGYSVYSVKDTPGYLLDGYDSTYSKYRDYAKSPFTIKPGAVSEYYGNVQVRIIGKVLTHLQDCDVRYTQKGHAYHQVLHCEYALDMA